MLNTPISRRSPLNYVKGRKTQNNRPHTNERGKNPRLYWLQTLLTPVRDKKGDQLKDNTTGWPVFVFRTITHRANRQQ